MAVIYSEQFQDQKTGIARFAVTLNKLNAEFQKFRTISLRHRSGSRRYRRNHQATAAGGATAGSNPGQDRHARSAKRDYQRRGEDAKAQYQKRYQDPVSSSAGRCQQGLDAYARARGITLIN